MGSRDHKARNPRVFGLLIGAALGAAVGVATGAGIGVALGAGLNRRHQP